MRRPIVAALVAVQAVLACGIFLCSLQLSQTIAASGTLDGIASAVRRSTVMLADGTRGLARSTRRLAQGGVRIRITIGDA